jgi:cell division protein ZapA
MAQVTIRINGYAYTIGCRDGEEQHLTAMATEVERRIDRIKAAAGPSGESRMLVMASLLMADELFEQQKRLAAAETQAAQAETRVQALMQSGNGTDTKLTRKLNRMARRAEEIAAGLEPH